MSPGWMFQAQDHRRHAVTWKSVHDLTSSSCKHVLWHSCHCTIAHMRAIERPTAFNRPPHRKLNNLFLTDCCRGFTFSGPPHVPKVSHGTTATTLWMPLYHGLVQVLVDRLVSKTWRVVTTPIADNSPQRSLCLLASSISSTVWTYFPVKEEHDCTNHTHRAEAYDEQV